MAVKVLFIDTRAGGDWGLDLLFAGLVANLGPDNVIDYPPQEKHRMTLADCTDLTGNPEADWGTERRSLGYHYQGSSMKRYSQSDITEELQKENIDFVFLDERLESFLEYLKLRLNFFKIPVIVVAGHDRFWNESPEFVRTSYYPKTLRRMFLDNWKPEYNSLPYARTYSWSVNFQHLSDPGQYDTGYKPFDIFFMGYNSGGHRAKTIDHIQERWGHLNNLIELERRPNKFDKFVQKREYFRNMSQSKICLNLRGDAESGKALRFYEIPFVGSYMLSEEFVNMDTPSFIDGYHCDFFKSLDEMDELIDYRLRNGIYREAIARQGHEFVMSEHTCQARVKRMLEDISRG